MSHEIEINAEGTAQFAFNGERGLPWHGLGQEVPSNASLKETFTAAGLDWGVSVNPVFTNFNGEFVQTGDQRAIQRDTDGAVFGIASKQYNPVQNSELVEFAEALLDSGDVVAETAGSLKGGRKVFISARIGEEVQVAGEDAYQYYLLATNSHDGKNALQVAVVPTRVVCQNTMTIALRSTKTSWSLSHRSTIKGRLEEARHSLDLTFKYEEAFEREVENLLQIEVTRDKFEDIVRGVLPNQKFATDKKVAQIMDTYDYSETLGNGVGTAYHALNAVTEWVSHKSSRTNEARAISNLWGAGSTLRDKTHSALLSLA